MKILITGHRGLVGGAFWQAFEEQGGHQLIGVDIDPSPCEDWDSRNRQIRADVRHWFDDGIRAYGPHVDLVIHCAATVGGRKTIDNSPLAIADNLAIDTALFQWAAKVRPGKVVYFSSSAVYPTYLQAADWTDDPLHEDDVDLASEHFGTPDAAYGWAKLSGERLAGYAAADGLNVLIPRPFSGYSHTQSRDYPFPSFIDRAKRRADPFEIWGDGQQVRDWIHVDDLVGCVLAAVDQGVTGPLNIGTGWGVRFVELAERVCKAAGYSPEFEFHLDAPRGVAYRVADVTRMNEIYTAKISLEEGIERALAYGRDVA